MEVVSCRPAQCRELLLWDVSAQLCVSLQTCR